MHTSSLLLLSVVFTSAHFTAAAAPLRSGCSTTMRCWHCRHPHNHVRRLSTLLELRTFSTSFNSSLLMSSCAKDKEPTMQSVRFVKFIPERQSAQTKVSKWMLLKMRNEHHDQWASLQRGKKSWTTPLPPHDIRFVLHIHNPTTSIKSRYLPWPSPNLKWPFCAYDLVLTPWTEDSLRLSSKMTFLLRKNRSKHPYCILCVLFLRQI